MSDNGYVEVQCGECHGGPITTKGGWLHCHSCKKELAWSDFDEGDVFWNPQWGVVLVTPERSLDVMSNVWTDLGLRLTPWHTGGGCMALGGVLSDGREVMVTNGDADLPGRWGGDDDLYAGVISNDGEERESAYEGSDLDAMIQHLRDQLREGDSA